MLSMRQLEVFWAVIRTENFTKAAAMLGISQPAVSKYIKHTEDVLGYKLFIRKNGRLQPSPEAELLIPVVSGIFDGVASARRFANELKSNRAGSIKVAAEPTLVPELVVLAVASFLETRPNVTVNVKYLSRAEVVAQVARQQVDVGLVCTPLSEPGLDTQVLFSTEFVAVVPEGHALASKAIITPPDTRGERLIAPPPTTWHGRRITDAFEQHRVPRWNAIDCVHPETAHALVGTMGGIAIAPPLHRLAPSYRGTVVRPFRPLVSIEALVVFRGDRPLAHLATAFIEKLHLLADAPPVPQAEDRGSA